jgi:hypothetical protein
MQPLPPLYKQCTNPLCDRKIKTSVAYCCYPCSKAHEDGYEIHEEGILGHTRDCNERHKDRGPYDPLKDS